MIDITFSLEHRLDLIQLAIHKTKAKSYLEIGCDKDQIFSKINVKNKIGVDPFRGGTHRMTSDSFFANNDQMFDVIFVDGLHYYDQVKKDVENSLNFLNANGMIIIHDMLPLRELHAEMPIPTPFRKPWLGDVWRLGFDLMAKEDIKFHIVTIDSGCGILWRDKQIPKIVDTKDTWNFYETNYNKLPLISYKQIQKEIKNAPFIN